MIKRTLSLAKLFKIERANEGSSHYLHIPFDRCCKLQTWHRGSCSDWQLSRHACRFENYLGWIFAKKPMSLTDKIVLLTTLSSSDDDSKINVAQSDEGQEANGSSNDSDFGWSKSHIKSFLFQCEDFNDLSGALVSFAPFESNSVHANQIARFCAAVFTGPNASITFYSSRSLTQYTFSTSRLFNLLEEKLKSLVTPNFHLILSQFSS